MFSRRREQLVLFLGLAVISAALGWYLVRQGRDYEARTQWMYHGVKAVESSVRASRPPQKMTEQNFSDIVTHNLFRPDRSNASPTEAAKMPEPPILYGTMNLGDGTFALMAAGNSASAPSKRVVPGDEIGGYKLVSIAGSKVVVEWGGKQTTIDVEESAQRAPRVAAATAPPPRAAEPRAVSTAGARVTAVAPSSGSSGASGGKSAGFTGFNAPPGAPPNAPPGTVFEGKKKVVRQTMFGPSVWWEDVTPQQKPDNKEN
jgi:hypothetical protein